MDGSAVLVSSTDSCEDRSLCCLFAHHLRVCLLYSRFTVSSPVCPLHTATTHVIIVLEVYIIQYTVHCVQYTMLYTVLYTVYSALCTVCSALYVAVMRLFNLPSLQVLPSGPCRGHAHLHALLCRSTHVQGTVPCIHHSRATAARPARPSSAGGLLFQPVALVQ